MSLKGMIATEAWVLHRGNPGVRAELQLEQFFFSEISPHEILVRPLYGCWEGNMHHALERSPVDICALRAEDGVVIGNAGVVEVIRPGKEVKGYSVGDHCIVFCNGISDTHGYPEKILGYDAAGTMGVMAKLAKFNKNQLIPLPREQPFALQQWAAFSLRYVTAWANWNVALACWRSQMPDVPASEIIVLGWGGGVALAELALAKKYGCQAILITSQPELVGDTGIEVIDRCVLDEDRFEKALLDEVTKKVGKNGVSILIDNLGLHFGTSIKLLSRQGVLTTSGWKYGIAFGINRARECITRHLFVHTHYAKYSEGLAAVSYAIKNGWAPSVFDVEYDWYSIPRLADDYSMGRLKGYYPIFSVQ